MSDPLEVERSRKRKGGSGDKQEGVKARSAAPYYNNTWIYVKTITTYGFM